MNDLTKLKAELEGVTRPKTDTGGLLHVERDQPNEGEGKLMAMDLSQEISMHLWHQRFLGVTYRTRGSDKTKNRYKRGGAGGTSR